MCSHVCSVCYWLIGNALLMYFGVVSLRLHLPYFDVCWSFGVAGSRRYPDDGYINVRNMLSIEEVK